MSNPSNDRRNLVTLANAVELITRASQEVIKNSSDISVEGDSRKRQAISDAAAARLNTNVRITLGG